jgi:hypothetical protein
MVTILGSQKEVSATMGMSGYFNSHGIVFGTIGLVVDGTNGFVIGSDVASVTSGVLGFSEALGLKGNAPYPAGYVLYQDTYQLGTDVLGIFGKPDKQSPDDAKSDVENDETEDQSGTTKNQSGIGAWQPGSSAPQEGKGQGEGEGSGRGEGSGEGDDGDEN